MLFPNSGGDDPLPSSMLFPDSGFEIAQEPLGRNPVWEESHWNPILYFNLIGNIGKNNRKSKPVRSLNPLLSSSRRGINSERYTPI